MPQLDIMSFSTQIFWVLMFLSILYCVLVRFVLPDLLLILRIRAKLLSRLQRHVQSLKEANKSDSKAFNASLKQLQETLNNPLFANKENIQVSSFLVDSINRQKMDMVSFLNSLNNKDKLNIFAPFLVLIAPTDEFILMLSFLFFFVMFYQFASPLIVKALFVNQTEELTTNFTKLSDLRKQNLQLTLTNAQLVNDVYVKSFTALLLYNALYTSLSLAIIAHSKNVHLNEALSLFKPSQASLDRSKARLMRLFASEKQFKPRIRTKAYTKLRLLLFICKHINRLKKASPLLSRTILLVRRKTSIFKRKI